MEHIREQTGVGANTKLFRAAEGFFEKNCVVQLDGRQFLLAFLS